MRQQKGQDEHSATSAVELVREFLDQAQLVADEGNGRNNRYKALLLVAAQVALQMHLSLRTIEKELPLHFQRLLVDGIVDFVEQPASQRSEFTRDIQLRPFEARVLHHRWTLRALVSQSQNGYLTSSNSSEAEDVAVNYQMALGDLTSSHLQIAQSIQAALGDDDQQHKLTVQTQLEAYYDLGMYFFSFTAYERAYGCFSRAAELIEDAMDTDESGDGVALPADDHQNLDGYLKACEAVLEAKAVTEGPGVARSPREQVETAWDARDWDKVVELLQNDLVASELVRFPLGYRAALEQQAFRLMRANCDTRASNDERLAASVVRGFYKKVAIGNAIRFHLIKDEDQPEDATDLEACACCCARHILGDTFVSAAHVGGDERIQGNLFEELAHFTLRLTAFLLEKLPSEHHKTSVKIFVSHLVEMTPSVQQIDRLAKLLDICGYSVSSNKTAGETSGHQIHDLLVVEEHIRVAAKRQCEQFRLLSDLSRRFEFKNGKEKEQFIAALRSQVAMMNAGDQVLPRRDAEPHSWRNVITFCLFYNCWDLLDPCKSLWKHDTLAQSEFELAGACGSLIRFLSSLSTSPLPGVQGGSIDTTGQGQQEKTEFSIVSSNKLMADVLLKRRSLVEVKDVESRSNGTSGVNEEENAVKLMEDLPVWIVETLVCISAGLLHRALMRNISDYRVTFDLTPYGDLAFLQAFAPEDGKAGMNDAVKIEPGSDASFGSSSFLRSYQSDLAALHRTGLACLVGRCGREPRWHCARADLALNPIVRQKLSATPGTYQPDRCSSSMHANILCDCRRFIPLLDPRSALKGYLVAASLATNYFADMASVVDIIDQTSLVRLVRCHFGGSRSSLLVRD